MSGPHPVVARTRLAVREVLAEVPRDGVVLVGYSGGADSLALLAAAAHESRRSGLRVVSCTVDHGLVEESGHAAALAVEAARGLGVRTLVRPVRVALSGGVEGSAREARYRELDLVARELGAALVLLGHTMDDQAETVLLRLARGSGARSLAGIPPERGPYRRPLLRERRADLREACRAQGLTWWEDPGNAAAGPLRRADGAALPRAAVREEALPALTRSLGVDPVPALARTADALREDADLLDDLAGEVLSGVRRGDGLDAGALADTARPLRTRVLHRWLAEVGSPPAALARTHVLAVDRLLSDWHGQGPITVPGGLRVRREGGTLAVLPAV